MSMSDRSGGEAGGDGMDSVRREMVALAWSEIEAEMESSDATTRRLLEILRDQVTECLLTSRLLKAERLTAMAYRSLAEGK